jgi:hypothetical protein
MPAQYITDADGNRTGIILDLDTYRQLLQAQEDLEDIRAAEAAKADDPEGLPLDQALAEIEQERARLQQAS